MQLHTPRLALTALATVGAVGAVLSLGATVASGRLAVASTAPPATMTAHVLGTRSGSLKPGTAVTASALFGQRIFASASNGFALANGPQAQYPALTSNGGKTWKIAGPPLHVDAADAPAVVDAVGIAGQRTDFSYGPSVIDVTSNGGRTWYQVFPEGFVVAVVPGLHGIAAYVQFSDTKGAVTDTAQYVSTNGGRSWKLSTAMGG